MFRMCRLTFCWVVLKEVGHVLLGQPDGLILQSNVNLQPPVFRAINEDLSLGRQIWFLGVVHVSKCSRRPSLMESSSASNRRYFNGLAAHPTSSCCQTEIL